MTLLPSPELCIAGRELGEPRCSPDGARVAFTVSWGGRSALAAVPVAGGPERMVSTAPEPRPGRGGSFTWTPDGTALVYVARDGNVWRQPFPGGDPIRLTDLGDGASPQAPRVSADGADVAIVVDLERLLVVDATGSGRRREIEVEGDFVTDPAWSPAGALAWQEWSVPAMAWDESRVVVLAPDGARSSVGTSAAQVQQPRFASDGALWALRDDHGWLNVWRDGVPFLEERFEHGRPTWGAGQRSYSVSPDARQVAVARNEDGFGRLVVAGDGTVRTVGRGVHTEIDWVGSTIVAIRSGAVTPPQIVVYDTSTFDRTVLATGASLGWDALQLTEPEVVRWRAADGAELVGRRYPAGGPVRRGVLCWLHGGPTDQADVSFNARFAFWTARGFDVFVPDHRGTTGHGRAYQQAMRERWGDLDVTDTVSGLRSAVEHGWAESGRIVLTGGSAGGFTALHVARQCGSLIAGAVVSYPVGDLIALDETTHRFEAHYNVSLVGPRPATEQRYLDRSPVTFADQITCPLLVFHGDADRVVGLDQSVTLVERVVDAGGSAELQVYPGEGHGFRDPSNIVDQLRRTEAFLARVLP